MQSVWLSIIVVTLPPTLYSIAVDEFYPFGYENGDAKMELRGDVVSSPLLLSSATHQAVKITCSCDGFVVIYGSR